MAPVSQELEPPAIPGRFKIPTAKYKISNWREYDQALQQRGSLTVWLGDRLNDAGEES